MENMKLKDFILRLATGFINVPTNDFDEHIHKSLYMVGSFLKTDRAYLFEYDHAAGVTNNTHEWCAEGVDPQIHKLQNIPMDPFADWMEAHLRGEPIQIPSVESLPEGPLREILEAQSIKSLISVPLMDDRRCLGFVGFDSVKTERQWEKDYVSLIQVLAEFYTNILKRQQIEQSLHASEKKHRELVEGLPIGLYQRTPDPEGKFITANRALADMLGYEKPEDLIGMTISSLCVDMKKRQNCSRKLHEGGIIKDQEVQFRRHNGEKFWVSVTARSIFDDQGNTVCVEGSVQDITDRKREEEEKEKLQAQLQQAQKIESIGRLAGGVAHDFNNLLVPILGYSELLLNTLDNNARQRGYVESIMEAGEKAKDIVKQLLAFSRKQMIKTAPVNINETVTGFRKFLRHTLTENIDIVLDLDSSTPIIKADDNQIEQVILNLAVNAQDAMPHGGRLTIKTAPAELDSYYASSHSGAKCGPYVMLSISDNGTGMDKQVQEQIFEPFFTTKPKERGTGLGLSTVYGIIKQHGGYIYVYSEPGIGTTFKIYLPVSDETAVAEKISLERHKGLKGRETVLLIEDEKKVRDFVFHVLRENGYKIIGASGPRDAQKRLEHYKGNIDLLLTDVVMPDMNGKEIYGVLKEMYPSLKVLYMSGYAPDIISLEEDRNFISKPFTISLLTKSVRRVLEEEQA